MALERLPVAVAFVPVAVEFGPHSVLFTAAAFVLHSGVGSAAAGVAISIAPNPVAAVASNLLR